MSEFAQQLGELQGRMQSFEDTMARHEADDRVTRDDIKAIRSAIDQAKGGWKTLMLVGGLAGAVGALVAKVIPFLGTLPR